jgi:hypothetical protein
VAVFVVILTVVGWQLYQNRQPKPVDDLDMTDHEKMRELIDPEELERQQKMKEHFLQMAEVVSSFSFPQIEVFEKKKDVYIADATPFNKEMCARALIDRTVNFIQKVHMFQQTAPHVVGMKKRGEYEEEKFETFMNAQELLKAEEAQIVIEANELKEKWGEQKENPEQNIFKMSQKLLEDHVSKLNKAREQAMKEGKDPTKAKVSYPQKPQPLQTQPSTNETKNAETPQKSPGPDPSPQNSPGHGMPHGHGHGHGAPTKEQLLKILDVVRAFTYPQIEVYEKKKQEWKAAPSPMNHEMVARAMIDRCMGYLQKARLFQSCAPHMMGLYRSGQIDPQKFQEFMSQQVKIKAEDDTIKVEANEIKPGWADVKQPNNIYAISSGIQEQIQKKMYAARQQAIKEGKDPSKVKLGPIQLNFGHGQPGGGHGQPGGGHGQPGGGHGQPLGGHGGHASPWAALAGHGQPVGGHGHASGGQKSSRKKSATNSPAVSVDPAKVKEQELAAEKHAEALIADEIRDQKSKKGKKSKRT